MFRIIAICIETASAAVILIPVILILKKLFRQDIKRVVCYIIFSLYLSAIYAAVGLFSINNITFDITTNFIPIIPIIDDFNNSILNIVLFIPLGIFLPLYWEKFNSMKQTLLVGAAMSVIIEILQIFTFRATDINDVIMNTLGTAIGYLIVKNFIKKQSIIVPSKNTNELYVLCGIVFIVMCCIQPFVSSLLWELVLYN